MWFRHTYEGTFRVSCLSASCLKCFQGFEAHKGQYLRESKWVQNFAFISYLASGVQPAGWVSVVIRWVWWTESIMVMGARLKIERSLARPWWCRGAFYCPYYFTVLKRSSHLERKPCPNTNLYDKMFSVQVESFLPFWSFVRSHPIQ